MKLSNLMDVPCPAKIFDLSSGLANIDLLQGRVAEAGRAVSELLLCQCSTWELGPNSFFSSERDRSSRYVLGVFLGGLGRPPGDPWLGSYFLDWSSRPELNLSPGSLPVS